MTKVQRPRKMETCVKGGGGSVNHIMKTIFNQTMSFPPPPGLKINAMSFIFSLSPSPRLNMNGYSKNIVRVHAS